MGELKDDLTLFQLVKKDEKLMQLMTEYETDANRLQALLNDPDYDAAEAIRLTNDLEYLSDEIQRVPLYHAFAEAKAKLDQSVSERASTLHLSGCNCAACQKARTSRKPYGESK